MSEIKDGGPAMPTNGPDHGVYGAGLSLRDYFAAKAMQGFCANSDHSVIDGPDFFGAAAMEAYLIADAMLAARGKQS